MIIRTQNLDCIVMSAHITGYCIEERHGGKWCVMADTAAGGDDRYGLGVYSTEQRARFMLTRIEDCLKKGAVWMRMLRDDEIKEKKYDIEQ